MLILDLAIRRPLAIIAATIALAAFGAVALQAPAIDALPHGLRGPLFVGATLALVVVFLFFRSARSTVVSAVVVSMSLLATLGTLRVSSFPLSAVALLGLALAVGGVIDDALVVRERIVNHVELGSRHRVAGKKAAAELGRAMATMTLVTLVFFAPFARVGGLVGPALAPLAVTVMSATVVSWFVSLSFVPILSANWPDRHGAELRRSWIGNQLDRLNGWLDGLADRYHEALAWSLDHRLAVMGIALGSLVLGVMLQAVVGQVGLLPRIDRFDMTSSTSGRADKPIQLELRGPDSKTLTGVARRIADEVRQIPGAVGVGLSATAAVAANERPSRLDSLDTSWLLRVQADIDRRALSDVATDIDGRLGTIPLPPGYTLIQGGEVAHRAWLARMADALVIAIVLTYLVLAIRFGSLIDPLVVFASVLSVAGVIGALLIVGHSPDLLTCVGALVGMGITAKHTIVLTYCARDQRARGTSWRLALIEAGRLRFRPVLMTASALVFATVPITMGQVFGSLGAAVIGGVLASVPLTLLVIPTFYELLQEAKGRVRGWLTVRRPPRVARGAQLELGD